MFIKISHLLCKAYGWILFSEQILRSQSRSTGGRRISENSCSLDDLEIGPGKPCSVCVRFPRKYTLVAIPFGLKANAFRGGVWHITRNYICDRQGVPMGMTREILVMLLAPRSSGAWGLPWMDRSVLCQDWLSCITRGNITPWEHNNYVWKGAFTGILQKKKIKSIGKSSASW